jgi:hypothetical protein
MKERRLVIPWVQFKERGLWIGTLIIFPKGGDIQAVKAMHRII